MQNDRTYISNFINDEIMQMPMILNSKLTKNGKKFNTRVEVDKIKKYIDDFIEGYDIQRYIVLPGIRGVGKTTILYQIYDYLLNEKEIPQNQILYFSCEDINNNVDCNIREITDILLEDVHRTKTRLLDKKIFLLIDEVNYDPNWSISGKILYDRSNNIFMIFTGSSALNFEYNADSARRLTKENISPLSYGEHIRLKYNVNSNILSKSLKNLLLTGEVDDAINSEEEIANKLLNTKNYISSEWLDYLRYGGFPDLLYVKDYNHISKNLVEICGKVIYIDMLNIKNFTRENQTNANRLIRSLAIQNSGETSYVKLSNNLNISQSNVRNIFEVLEKTHLLFHIEPYGGANKRIRGAWKYYFATSSIKHALASEKGNTLKTKEQYEGILIENLVASSLSNFSNFNHNLYYDGGKKSNVDFILANDFEKPVPIEVGRGKKDKQQIKTAINKYDADFGVVISNRTNFIEKKDGVIFIPVKTFSFL